MTHEGIREQIKLIHEAAGKRREEARGGPDRIDRMQARAEARGLDEAAAMLSRALDAVEVRR